jgi:hypothetical protein
MLIEDGLGQTTRNLPKVQAPFLHLLEKFVLLTVTGLYTGRAWKRPGDRGQVDATSAHLAITTTTGARKK